MADVSHERGRPFNVTSHGAYERHDDGTVTRIVWRRTEDPSEMYHEHRFHGADVEAADAAYEAWTDENFAVIKRRAERRAKWGPLGTGKMG